MCQFLHHNWATCYCGRLTLVRELIVYSYQTFYENMSQGSNLIPCQASQWRANVRSGIYLLHNLDRWFLNTGGLLKCTSHPESYLYLQTRDYQCIKVLHLFTPLTKWDLIRLEPLFRAASSESVALSLLRKILLLANLRILQNLP